MKKAFRRIYHFASQPYIHVSEVFLLCYYYLTPFLPIVIIIKCQVSVNNCHVYIVMVSIVPIIHPENTGAYRNLVIFRIENISYVIISCSFNFVRSPYRI